MISGNHDFGTTKKKPVQKDVFATRESVILENTRTKQQLFVLHGHQADLLSQRYRPLDRAAVCYLLEPLL